jgi:endonuclease YncB( thermonuclease family)
MVATARRRRRRRRAGDVIIRTAREIQEGRRPRRAYRNAGGAQTHLRPQNAHIVKYFAIPSSSGPGFSMISRARRAFCLSMAAVALCAGPARAGCSGLGDERAVVAAIGARGEILLSDGRAARLAGLDIPDPSRGEPETADDARVWLSSRLVGREVQLRRLGAATDRWGRLLADIAIAGPDSPPGPVSLALLSAGLARVRPEAEARDCLAERLAAEEAARTSGLGLWTDSYYGVVEATDLDDLGRRDGQFAIVEGVVSRVGQGRERTWLDFGRRGGFSAVVAARQTKAFERAGLVLSALAGARIRVRGAMDNRFGLRMPIAGPEQIERLAQSAGPGAAGPSR